MAIQTQRWDTKIRNEKHFSQNLYVIRICNKNSTYQQFLKFTSKRNPMCFWNLPMSSYKHLIKQNKHDIQWPIKLFKSIQQPINLRILDGKACIRSVCTSTILLRIQPQKKRINFTHLKKVHIFLRYWLKFNVNVYFSLFFQLRKIICTSMLRVIWKFMIEYQIFNRYTPRNLL